ncbi:DUF1488 family protein [Sphingomonas parapaucimobilis]|uniref:DUF1488 family protein n=1 Tax=Sphingomonas parapaucimobilis TaxID=28213 RepID=UPI00321B4BFD
MNDDITFPEQTGVAVNDEVAFSGIRYGEEMRFRVTHEALEDMSGDRGTAAELFARHRDKVYEIARKTAAPVGPGGSGYILLTSHGAAPKP